MDLPRAIGIGIGKRVGILWKYNLVADLHALESKGGLRPVYFLPFHKVFKDLLYDRLRQIAWLSDLDVSGQVFCVHKKALLLFNFGIGRVR